ncbi:MAG: hypothetical protein U0931_30410 [Vulcanimicrobiota bacterium]
MVAPTKRAQTPQSRLRQKIEKVVATAGEVIGAATAALPGAVVGGLYAAESQLPPDQRHTRELGALLQAGMSVASSAGQQNVGQWLLDIPNNGLSLSNWSSALAGSAWQYYSGGCGNIASGIFAAIDASGDKDTGPLGRVTDGLTKGFLAGARGGAHEGRMQGLGMVDGVIEGSQDALRAIFTPGEVPNVEPPALNSRWGQALVYGAGLVGGTVGATLGALDGAVQGGARGVSGERRASSLSRHRFQVALAGAVGGAFLFGPAGAACGALLGQWAGTILPDDAGLHRALNESFANDSDLGDAQANTYRNTVEGGLVGCLVGARSGINIGKQQAQRAVSELWKSLSTHTNEEKSHENSTDA